MKKDFQHDLRFFGPYTIVDIIINLKCVFRGNCVRLVMVYSIFSCIFLKGLKWDASWFVFLFSEMSKQKAIAVGDIKMAIQTEHFCLLVLWLWDMINVSASSIRRTWSWMKQQCFSSQHIHNLSVAGVVCLERCIISAISGKWSHVN